MHDLRPSPITARLDLALVSPGSPERLRIPVSMASGRILELGLPLCLSTKGGRDLDGVRLRIAMPTEITYVASLDRMTGSALGLPGARAAYFTGDGQTFIDIELPRTPGGAEVEIPIPVCVKGPANGEHLLAISATGGGLEPIERYYQLELSQEAEGEFCELVETEKGSVWICRPDEGQRQRDPRLPLDRIARFKVEDPAPAPAETAPVASTEPAAAEEPAQAVEQPPAAETAEL
jgi:hypothetical protein